MPESIALSHEECLRLLAGGVSGRIALSSPNGPHIIPINYAVIDDAVIVRTSPYSLLGTYGRDTMLAFEVDWFDHARQRGWSVVARGRGEVVTDAREIEHIRDTREPRPWASGARNLYLRLRWSELTGRRIGVAWDVVASMPVRRS